MKPAHPYLEGNAIKVRARPRSGDAVTDASSWRLLVQGPGEENSTEYPMSLDDGIVTGTFTPDSPGRWRYRVETTEPANAAIEGYFQVAERTVDEPA